ncbi:MAG: DUF2127 domain-containing protein [Nitrososphaeraceae archaeon]
MTEPIKRPIGVTIISILAIIDGILLIFGGLSLLAFGAFFTSAPIENQITEDQQLPPQQSQNAAELQALIQYFGSIGVVIGSIVLAVGVGYLIVSYGLLKGKGWAWIVTIILTIIAIITQVTSVISTSTLSQSLSTDINALLSGITAHIIGIAINGVILYYLYRPNVKAFFGRSKPQPSISK